MGTETFLAFLIAFGLSMALFPGVIGMLRRLKAGQIISTDGPQAHLAKQGTPTMGGILIVLCSSFAALIVAVVAESWDASYFVQAGQLGLLSMGKSLVPILLMFLAYAGLGFLDDYLIVKKGKALGLRAREKLLGQFVIAIAFVGWLAYTKPFGALNTSLVFGENGQRLDLGYFYYALAVLYIVGFSNAVNITDGVDGLVGGMSTITAAALWFGMIIGTAAGAQMSSALLPTSLSLLCFAIAGACLAFLWFNSNPAKVFMGDTGSLALGAVFAGIALLTKQEIALLIYGLLFIVEIFSIVIQSAYFKYTRRKYGEGRRIFKMSPLHHHFELSGWPEQLIVSRFWIISIICAVAGLLGRFWGIW